MSATNPKPKVNGSEQSKDVASTQPRQSISVLFVCLGNICRSPMAEGVFRSMTSSHARISKIDSAGTGAYHEGDPPDSRTMDTLEANNIDDYDHQARKVTPSDFTDFDYILAMDKENRSDLIRMSNRLLQKDPNAESQMGKILLFGDFGGRGGEQVMDPYYGAKNGFTVAYEQMVRFSNGFIEQVLESETQA